ncbi:MAG: hypothetical protein WBV69_02700 [Candidatus Sulfotelmatobacter sp.]
MLEFYKRTTNFWQALFRVGVPFVALYRVGDYLTFLARGGHARSEYLPWRVFVPMDVVVVLLLSTLWWTVMRSVFGKDGHQDNG